MKNKILHVASTLLFSFNQWIQVILITRLIGLYEMGLFSYFLAIVAPLVLFSRFSFSDLVPTQRKYSYGYTIFARFRGILNYVFLLSMAGFALVMDFKPYEMACLMLFSLFKFYETKEEFIYTENIAEANIRFLAHSKIIKSVVTIVCFTLAVVFTRSLMAAIISLLAAQVLVYYSYDRRFTSYDHHMAKLFGRMHFKHIFWLGIGLSLVGLLSSLNANVPRYFIEHYHSVEDLGIYATIMYFAAIASNIVITVNQSYIAELAQAARQSFRKFYGEFFRMMGIYLAAIVLGNAVLILYGNDILVFVYGEAFHGHQTDMVLLGVFISLIVFEKSFEMALNVFNLYNIQVTLQTVNLILTVALSALLIVPYGIRGGFIVAVITAAAIVLSQVSTLLLTRKY
ncbi:lipopolysaccharide biosynthesis protein [Salinicoccus carnicancri]|uniref:lipopolysaccharide biosynthesis protein n=1 Tax=Salinicoccus carnicancri TaxID=558170 RepID=UPI0002F800D5|nr:oligosaccharide flippase family protein [Salinicoccus carnicancri]